MTNLPTSSAKNHNVGAYMLLKAPTHNLTVLRPFDKVGGKTFKLTLKINILSPVLPAGFSVR